MIKQFSSFLSGLTKKAAKIECDFGMPIYSTSPYKLITGEYNAIIHTPVSLVNLNSHWVNICNKKNAELVATTPLKLYYQKTSSKKLLSEHKTLSTIEQKALKNKMNIKKIGDIVEITDHPFLNLLTNINDTMNYTDFISLIQQYLGLIGNSYVYVQKDSSGLPENLYPLLSEYVTIVLDDEGKVKEYKYQEPARKEIVYPKDDIIQFINYQPGSIISGRGDLEGCLAAVTRLDYYDARENALNKNNARPDFVVSFKTPLSQDESKDIYNAFYKKFGTVKNAGKPLITSECTILPLGFSTKDLEYPEGRIDARNLIINSFGVPESIIALNSSNYASSATANFMYYKYTIIPKIRKMCEKINEKLLPLYDDNLYVWYDVNIDEDIQVSSSVYNSYVASGVMTKDEVREKLGLTPLTTNNVTGV